MTEKAGGQSQAWDASDRDLGASSLQKGGERAHQACASKRKQAKLGKRLKNYGNMAHTTHNREWWAIQLNRYKACPEREVCLRMSLYTRMTLGQII